MCYDSGELGWYESGEREKTSVCVGTHEGRSETAVDVPDHGDALSPDREETIMTIQFEIQTVKCRSINTESRSTVVYLFGHNSEGIIVTS